MIARIASLDFAGPSAGRTLPRSPPNRVGRWTLTEVQLGRIRLPTFRLAMYIGGVIAAAVVLPLGAERGMSPWILAGLLLTAYPVIVVMAKVRVVLTGRENLTLYHHAIAYVLAAALLVRLMGLPVLTWLDLLAVALGCTIAVGRLGCTVNGCCHGRLARWGVRYGPAHVRNGFPAHLAGVRLLPVPVMESAGVVVVTGVALARVRAGGTEGAAMVSMTVGYAALRFVLEFLRGDAVRPYRAGLSEAQWTSVVLLGLAVTAGFAGWLPLLTMHYVVALAVCLGAGIGVWRERASGGSLLGAGHVNEVARSLTVAPTAMPTRTVHTSMGLTLTRTILDEPDGPVQVISFSSPERRLLLRDKHNLARTIAALVGANGPRIVEGKDDVTHVVAGCAGSAAGGGHAV